MDEGHRNFLYSDRGSHSYIPLCLLQPLPFQAVTTKHYKKTCFLPLAIRHVYGHCTRGELLATCKWPRKYTWRIQMTLITQLAACILIHVAKWPRVLKYTCLTISRMYFNTRGHLATCIKKYTWLTIGRVYFNTHGHLATSIKIHVAKCFFFF
jgi:hypothetical protein